MKSPRSTQVMLAVALVAAVAFLIYTMSSNRPSATNTRRTARRARTVATARAAKPLAPAAPSDAEFGRYEMIIARDVFSPHPPPPPPKNSGLPPLVVAPPPNAGTGPVAPVEPPPPQAPSFPDWTYVGYIGINGKTLGIIQNLTDRTVEYLAVGESFRGAAVTKVNSTDIEFTVPGAPPTLLHRPETWQLTPLDKAATPGQQGRAVRPQPGGQPSRGG